jgi:hypothetical protein
LRIRRLQGEVHLQRAIAGGGPGRFSSFGERKEVGQKDEELEQKLPAEMGVGNLEWSISAREQRRKSCNHLEFQKFWTGQELGKKIIGGTGFFGSICFTLSLQTRNSPHPRPTPEHGAILRIGFLDVGEYCIDRLPEFGEYV